MIIFRPVKTNLIVQGYGVSKTAPSMMALYKSLGLLAHDGLDFSVSCKDGQVKTGGQCEPIYCDIDGYAIIKGIYKDVKTGFGIVAQDQDGYHKHLWWHFDSINPALQVNSKIEGGDFLGIAGNTGISTGAHLHRALYEYGQEDNGYKGAIDIEPFYRPIFVLDFIQTLKTQISLLQKVIETLKKLLGK